MSPQIQTLLGIAVKQLTLPAILGASVPFALLLFISIAANDPFEPWMYLPLTLIPLGGACGGIFFYLMGFLWFPRGTKKLIAVIFSIVLYFVIVWMSSVLAFAITGHWD
jgi:hypothetical protein